MVTLEAGFALPSVTKRTNCYYRRTLLCNIKMIMHLSVP